MQGITKGTVLGNRYELTSEISDAPGLARWIARDEKLGRDVAITVVGSRSAHADAALDSARRAAGVEDPRLVRVLDAGRDVEFAYIVEEPHTGAYSLADLARFEPMHPEEARRIVGETASALEAARQRGLHHLILTPRHVLRLADGSIAVTQVAVGGSLAGRDDVSSSEATAIDTRALVDLLYTALTGTWPGDPQDIEGLKGIELAQRRADGQIATPAEIVDGVPSDLDAMCRQVLNTGDGPRTPGEVARQLAPWSAQIITAPGRGRRSVETDDDTADEPESTFVVRRADERAGSGDGAGKRSAVGAVGAAALAAAGSSKGGSDKSASGKAGATSSGVSTVKKSGTKNGSSSTDDVRGDDATDPGAKPAVALPRKPAPRRVNEPDPADATMVGRPVAFDADETTQFNLDDEDAAYARTSYDPSFEELEPPVPGFNGGTDDPDPASSKLALVLVGLIVLGALVLAIFGLQGIAGSSDKPDAAAKPSTSASSPKGSSAPSSASSAAPAGTPVQAAAATLVNAQGARQSGSLAAANAIDGNPDTVWMSLRYRRASWGGDPDMGGVSIDLGSQTAVKTIKVTPGKRTPLTADVYVSDTPGKTGTKVGSMSSATSEQTISTNASGRYVTVFIPTQTKPAGQSYYESSIAEVTVSK